MKLLNNLKVLLGLLVDARTGVLVTVVAVGIVIWDHIPKQDTRDQKPARAESGMLATPITPASGIGYPTHPQIIVGNDSRQQNANLETHGNNSPISVNFGVGPAFNPADVPDRAKK